MAKNIIIRLTLAVLSVIAMSSCDPYYTMNTYVRNTTSQTIVISSLSPETIDSVSESYHYFSDSIYDIRLESGEKVLWFNRGGLGTVFVDDIVPFMKLRYPYGLKIKFENGDSLVYYHSRAITDFHSPFNLKSFFSVDKADNEVVAEYDVLY